ncbi:hypothetical protein IWQ62_004387 [Dispira parvispora]|uniref:Aldehyde dehydrogenase domain-containing protein n=1 Tax=Dispira parvispora TaxID=1520584 RepID=A0A9W8APX5_9FUNG|nr:hypothetical protein IWQ62_004387 [Dispira parvispora]
MTDNANTLEVISPYSGKVVMTRPYATRSQVGTSIDQATVAYKAWRRTSLADRITLAEKLIGTFEAKRDTLAPEISLQMGRPVRYAQGEVNGLLERSRYVVSIAKEQLADHTCPDKAGFVRFIRKEPLGVVLVIAPWNFPYVVAINAVLPAVLAGNVVIIKHAPQTPLCGERLAECFAEAGFPPGVVQSCVWTHQDCDWAIEHLPINFVNFTGSVATGKVVAQAACHRLVGTGMELGGKDPAYVRSDADLPYTVEQLVDGAMFNSGQSCCSVERIYVHQSVYDEFVNQFVTLVKQYRLGDPSNPATTLGPVVNRVAAERIRQQIKDAVAMGAKVLVPEDPFRQQIQPQVLEESAFVVPQVLVNVNHKMDIMINETFGPVVCIMSVSTDEEAIRLMNDSQYGLTASIWTQDQTAALNLGDQIETGTFFMNRCDYLDPELAWTGTKYSGRGCTLSPFGFDQFIRYKSFHMKLSGN